MKRKTLFFIAVAFSQSLFAAGQLRLETNALISISNTQAISLGLLRRLPDNSRLLMPWAFEVDKDKNCYFLIPNDSTARVVKISKDAKPVFDIELDFTPNHICLFGKKLVLFNDIVQKFKGRFLVIGSDGKKLKSFKKEIPVRKFLSSKLDVVNGTLVDDKSIVSFSEQEIASDLRAENNRAKFSPAKVKREKLEKMRKSRKKTKTSTIDQFLGTDMHGRDFEVYLAPEENSEGSLQLLVVDESGNSIVEEPLAKNVQGSMVFETVIFRSDDRLYQMWSSSSSFNVSEIILSEK